MGGASSNLRDILGKEQNEHHDIRSKRIQFKQLIFLIHK